LPAGPRLAVVGNSTALGVLVSNASAAEGLTVTRLDDIGVDATPAAFGAALRAALDDESVDTVVVVFVPPLQPARVDDVAGVVRDAAAAAGKPVLSTFLGFEGVPSMLAAEGTGSPPPGSVPSYPSPERAVRALARAVRYAAWRSEARSPVPEVSGTDLPTARALVERVLADAPAGRDLDIVEAGRLLAAVGVVLSHEVPAEAVPVVLAVREDPSFGALASFGIAGVATELLDDRSYAAVPLTIADAEQLVRSPRAAPLLTGYGGAAPADLLALSDLLLRLSALADAVPELAECTLRVLAAPIGAQVESVHARVAPASARVDTGPRRLRGL